MAVHQFLAGEFEPVRPSRGRNHRNVRRNFQAGRGQRQQRQRQSVVAPQQAHPIERTGDDSRILKLGESTFRIVEGRVDRGLRERPVQGQNNPLRPTALR